ncbi:Protein of unknown function (DUF2924) [Shimia isoporae]|uniref:DUF2924 family protein n=1 Tax=Shimia isoporae TaxID=647720 RepID=A0A4R1NJQ8_9RHOB|nr:DUF2924 domain-containing protein [Shimia isoporae]TCL08255.1 Protein of unknown function (DUF2924) [Shimia isoporae]
MTLPPPGEIASLDRDALSDAWREALGSVPPPRMSQTFMRRVLSFEAQAQQQGGLPKAVQKALRKEAGKARATKTPQTTLKLGGRLLREWNGVTHVVDVTEGGFLWNGDTYRSLSIIARTITGSHWSGPRFFGLTRKGVSK